MNKKSFQKYKKCIFVVLFEDLDRTRQITLGDKMT